MTVLSSGGIVVSAKGVSARPFTVALRGNVSRKVLPNRAGFNQNKSRTFCTRSGTRLGPYLEEYIINPEWHTAFTPPSWYFWHISYTALVSGSYLAFILHYNYYHYGQMVLRTHTGLTLTEDSW